MSGTVSYRDRVIEIAQAEIGPQTKGSAKVYGYWRDVLPATLTDAQVKHFAAKAEYCGGFALWCLRQAGLAKDVDWKIGQGFLYQLPQTRTPSRGDIGYLPQPFQHHLLFAYEHDGKVHSIDGNQPDVREKTRPRQGMVFYSIQPLIDAVETVPRERDTLPVPKMPTVWIGHCDIIIGLELQRLLVAKGFPLKVDGVFGPKTHAVVKQFQLVSALTTDGIVGEKTWLALMT